MPNPFPSRGNHTTITILRDFIGIYKILSEKFTKYLKKTSFKKKKKTYYIHNSLALGKIIPYRQIVERMVGTIFDFRQTRQALFVRVCLYKPNLARLCFIAKELLLILFNLPIFYKSCGFFLNSFAFISILCYNKYNCLKDMKGST